MKEVTITGKNGIIHWVYIGLLKIVDLSELIYNKLNYIKSNYKDLLINIFDEDDYSTQNRSNEDYTDNKYIKPIINWLSSLFGLIEEEDEVIISYQSNINIFIKKYIISKPIQQKYFHLSILILLTIMYLVFYSFT